MSENIPIFFRKMLFLTIKIMQKNIFKNVNSFQIICLFYIKRDFSKYIKFIKDQ